jgi:hypothetical protein
LDVKFGLRSADVIAWLQDYQDTSTSVIYIEEVFSPIRLGFIALLLASFILIGGSVFTSQKGRETSTQSWLAVTSILVTVLLFGLSPWLARKI